MPERVSRADRYRQAKALRDEGLLLREIGGRMGLSVKMVSDLLNDPDGSKGRARRAACEERKRRDCPDCGEPMGVGSAWRDTYGCRSCYHRRQAEAHEDVLAFVEWMYNEGRPLREIAEELGWGTASSAGVVVNELRKAGRVGYRYKAYEQRVAA